MDEHDNFQNTAKRNRTADLDRIRNEILNQVNIMDVINEYGFDVRKVGKDFRIRCPFHPGDTNASMSIQPQTQVFHCFSCKEKGRGALEFVYKFEKLKNPSYTLMDAILFLKNRYNLEVSNINEIQNQIKKEKYTVLNETYNNDKISIIRTNEKINSIFEVYLKNNLGTSKIQAQRHYDYLISRGLTPEIIDKFQIGFCPRGALAQFYKGTDSVQEKTDILSTGLVSINSRDSNRLTEFYSDRITFPIKDMNGNIIGFTARTLDPRDAAKYKNSKENSVFQKSNLLYGLDIAKDKIRETGKVILVEGNMDVIASHQLGLDNAVGLNGCSISDRQIELIRSLNADVIIALDNDLAGRKGTVAIGKKLKGAGIKATGIDVSDFGPFKDNGEILEESLENDNILDNFKEKYLSLEKTMFEFELKYGLFENRAMNVDTIREIYNEIEPNINGSEKVLFKKYCSTHSEFSREDIEDIISTQENKKNFYSQIGMMIIDPYLNEKNLNDKQKEVIVAKILANIDTVLTSGDNKITMNTDVIDSLINDTFRRTEKKLRTQALKNEIKCREIKKDIFTLEGMIERHKEIFAQSSDAGKLRTRNIREGHFAKAYEIEPRFNELCQKIKSFPKNESLEARERMLASAAADIISIKMFSNKSIGRVERIFIEETAKELGLSMDFEKGKNIYVMMYKNAVLSACRNGREGSDAFYKLFQKICDDSKEIENKFELIQDEPDYLYDNEKEKVFQ